MGAHKASIRAEFPIWEGAEGRVAVMLSTINASIFIAIALEASNND